MGRWRAGEAVGLRAVDAAGLYIFTSNAMGPPGRAHGGAVATVFDDVMGLTCVRELGFLPAFNTVELSVEYRRGMPLGVPVLVVARLLRSEERRAWTEAAILAP